MSAHEETIRDALDPRFGRGRTAALTALDALVAERDAALAKADQTEQDCADYIAEENQLMRQQAQVFLQSLEEVQAREMLLAERLDVVEAERDRLLAALQHGWDEYMVTGDLLHLRDAVSAVLAVEAGRT